MRVPLHIVESRRESLAKLLGEHRYLNIADLCERLGVSEATVRRDLSALERAEKITRTYGGAMGQYEATFASLRARSLQSQNAKAKIAAICYSTIQSGMTVFLDAGTTVLSLSHLLVEKPFSGLLVITNNLAAAEMLATEESIKVYLLGGRILSRQAMTLESGMGQQFSRWKIDASFLSAEGMDSEGVYNSLPDIVSVQRGAMAVSKATYLCLDSSKIGHRTDCRLATWNDKFRLITNVSNTQLSHMGIPIPPEQLLSS